MNKKKLKKNVLPIDFLKKITYGNHNLDLFQIGFIVLF